MKNPLRKYYENKLETLIQSFPRGAEESKAKKSEASYFRTLTHLDTERCTRNGIGDCVVEINVDLKNDGHTVAATRLREIADLGEDGMIFRHYDGSPQELSIRALRSVCVEIRRVQRDLGSVVLLHPGRVDV